MAAACDSVLSLQSCPTSPNRPCLVPYLPKSHDLCTACTPFSDFNFHRRYRATISKRVKKENGEDVCQAEMFIVTRQSRTGKQMDPETNTVVDKLKDSLQNSTEFAGQTFQSIFGKEKSGRVRCFGRTITPTMLKRNQEIVAVKKECAGKINSLSKRVEGLEALLKCVLKQTNPDLDDEAPNDIMGEALGSENSAAYPSSTSTHFPNEEHNPNVEEDQAEAEWD